MIHLRWGSGIKQQETLVRTLDTMLNRDIRTKSGNVAVGYMED